MNHRHSRRFATAVLAALAVSGAWAIEAEQWNPQAGRATAVANTDALREPGAWTVGRGEATEFHDGIALDTMSTRADVRQDLALARTRGWLPDAGEAGATDRVWRRRAAYATSKRDGELAAVKSSPDPIGAIAAIETRPPVNHGLYALAPAKVEMRLPSNTTAEESPTVLTPPLSGEARHEDMLAAEGPRAIRPDEARPADVVAVATH